MVGRIGLLLFQACYRLWPEIASGPDKRRQTGTAPGAPA
jgi:hypothetical protein